MRVIEALRRLPKTDGKFGIEIEVEGSRLDIPNNKFWKMEIDGSLRPRPECVEYVFRTPLSYKDSVTAIHWLNANHAKRETKLDWSFRCSTHVHLNVQEYELSRLFRLLFIYYILENLLVHWSGKEREGNRFCLRMADSGEIPIQTSRIFRENLQPIEENRIRYSALNIASLRKYGSIEFRSLNGTTEFARLDKWLKAIVSLEAASQRYESVEAIFKAATKDINRFAIDVFGEEFFKELFYTRWEQSALYNISLCIDFFDTYQEILKNEQDYHQQLQQRQREREALERIHEEHRRAENGGQQGQAAGRRRDRELGEEGFIRAAEEAADRRR